MTPTEYLEAEFRRYFTDASAIVATFHDDETITVRVDYPGSEYVDEFHMEIGSDDDYFIFTNANGATITVPFMPESDA